MCVVYSYSGPQVFYIIFHSKVLLENNVQLDVEYFYCLIMFLFHTVSINVSRKRKQEEMQTSPRCSHSANYTAFTWDTLCRQTLCRLNESVSSSRHTNMLHLVQKPQGKCRYACLHPHLHLHNQMHTFIFNLFQHFFHFFGVFWGQTFVSPLKCIPDNLLIFL